MDGSGSTWKKSGSRCQGTPEDRSRTPSVTAGNSCIVKEESCDKKKSASLMAGNDTGADSSKKAKALSLSVTPEVRDAYGRQR